MNQANLKLHIKELILHNLPHGQAQRIAAAIEQELTRLFTEQFRPGSRPEAIGQQVAQAILGNMNAASQPVQSSRTDAAGMSAQNRGI